MPEQDVTSASFHELIEGYPPPARFAREGMGFRLLCLTFSLEPPPPPPPLARPASNTACGVTGSPTGRGRCGDVPEGWGAGAAGVMGLPSRANLAGGEYSSNSSRKDALVTSCFGIPRLHVGDRLFDKVVHDGVHSAHGRMHAGGGGGETGGRAESKQLLHSEYGTLHRRKQGRNMPPSLRG